MLEQKNANCPEVPDVEMETPTQDLDGLKLDWCPLQVFLTSVVAPVEEFH